MRKRDKVIIGLSIVVYAFWLMADLNSSYGSPLEATYRNLDKDLDLLSVEAFVEQDESLVFLFTQKNDVAAVFSKRGQFGWKFDEMMWAGMGSSLDFGMFAAYGFEDRLIYGLLKNAEDKIVMVNGERAVMMELNMFNLSEIDQYGLEDLSLWYFDAPPTGTVSIELVDFNTGDVIEQVELEVTDD